VSEQFSLNMLGGFALQRGDRPVDLPPACQRMIALVAAKQRPVHRLWVCAMLWPHAQTRRATASLRSAMWRLQPVGAEALLVVDPQYVALSPEVRVDLHEARDHIECLLDHSEPAGADPTLIAELLPLLRAGDLLDGWDEAWVVRERDAYRATRAAALDLLGRNSDKQVPHYSRTSRHSVHPLRPVAPANNDPGEP